MQRSIWPELCISYTKFFFLRTCKGLCWTLLYLFYFIWQEKPSVYSLMGACPLEYFEPVRPQNHAAAVPNRWSAKAHRKKVELKYYKTKKKVVQFCWWSAASSLGKEVVRDKERLGTAVIKWVFEFLYSMNRNLSKRGQVWGSKIICWCSCASQPI